jgi:putative SOS response-associated peptidase YedK
MCFQSKLSKKAAIIESRFKATFEQLELYSPQNVIKGFDFPKSPVILHMDTSAIKMVNWGLVPHWAQDISIRKYTLNARIETLTEKPAFRSSVANRCIVLTDGFYEWQHVGKEKYMFEIGYGDALFAFAGLYDEYDGQLSYTIVTREAQGVMREIHNTKLRMPYALHTDESMNAWLSGGYPDPFYAFTTKPELGNQLSMF